MPDRLFDWRVVPRGTPLVSAAVLVTNALDLQMLDRLVALDVLLTGATPDVLIEYAEGKQRSADDTIDWGAYIQVSASVTTVGVLQTFALATPLSRFVCFRFTGNGGNGADTVLEVDLVAAEKV